jgi:hypothetical protein
LKQRTIRSPFLSWKYQFVTYLSAKLVTHANVGDAFTRYAKAISHETCFSEPPALIKAKSALIRREHVQIKPR